MTFLLRIFGAVEPRFLARSYVLGVAIFALMTWLLFQAAVTPTKLMQSLMLFGVSTLLYPFAKLVWNEIRNFLMGDNVIFANAILVMASKLVINIALWSFAVFVAPVGMAYLWFRTRDVGQGVHTA